MRIFTRDDRLGDEHGNPQARIGLQQRLLQEVADHADGLGADHIQGRCLRTLIRLTLERQVPDLGPSPNVST